MVWECGQERTAQRVSTLQRALPSQPDACPSTSNSGFRPIPCPPDLPPARTFLSTYAASWSMGVNSSFTCILLVSISSSAGVCWGGWVGGSAQRRVGARPRRAARRPTTPHTARLQLRSHIKVQRVVVAHAGVALVRGLDVATAKDIDLRGGPHGGSGWGRLQGSPSGASRHHILLASCWPPHHPPLQTPMTFKEIHPLQSIDPPTLPSSSSSCARSETPLQNVASIAVPCFWSRQRAAAGVGMAARRLHNLAAEVGSSQQISPACSALKQTPKLQPPARPRSRR